MLNKICQGLASNGGGVEGKYSMYENIRNAISSTAIKSKRTLPGTYVLPLSVCEHKSKL